MTDTPAAAGRLTAERLPALKINCPDLFRDPAFVSWLNDPHTVIATWHCKGDPPGEYADVFVTFDHGEGSDAADPGWPDGNGMPAHCWARLVTACRYAGIDYGLLWLTNVEE